ncbi:hypothetical protein ACG04Q_25565, partial [Roseateles sp. DXS20W]
GSIALPRIEAALANAAGGERLSVNLLGLPDGATLTDGVRSAAGGVPVDLAGWDVTRLSLVAPAGFTGEFSLTVVAASVETSNGASASVSQGITVRVLPGTAVATPVGVNPFVITATQAQATQRQAGSSAVADASAAALALLA